MDPTRRDRYLDKIDHARGRVALVEEWQTRAQKDIAYRLALYKAFQEAAEAAADLAAMLLTDSGVPPKDDYANFEKTAAAIGIGVALVAPLAEATGLRNRLVHEYDRLDDTLALSSCSRLGRALTAYFAEVEGWISTRV